MGSTCQPDGTSKPIWVSDMHYQGLVNGEVHVDDKQGEQDGAFDG